MTCEECIHNEVCNPAVSEAFCIGAMNEVERKCIFFTQYKQGKWIKRRNERTCSVCKFIYYNNSDDFNFCPNCGADMFDLKDAIKRKNNCKELQRGGDIL